MTTCTKTKNNNGTTFGCSNPNIFYFVALSDTVYQLDIQNFLPISSSPSDTNIGYFNPNNYVLKNQQATNDLTLYQAYYQFQPYCTFTYSYSLNGTIDGTLCNCTTSLMGQPFQPYQSSGNVPGNTVTLATIPQNDKTYDGSQWGTIASNVSWMMYSLRAYTDYDGSCPCWFDNPYVSLYLNLRIQLTINLNGYCLQPNANNILQPLCYDYISQQCTRNDGCPEFVTQYLQDYCITKFPPPDGLDIFNQPLKISQMDANLCGCNMPTSYYETYENDLLANGVPAEVFGSIKSACLIPACYNSAFQPTALSGCPVPQCINNVTFSGNNIDGPVDVVQSAQCDEYEGNSGSNGPSGTQPPSTTSFWQKYKYYLLGGGIVLIVFLIVIIVLIIAIRK